MNYFKNFKTRQSIAKGFTLIELVVVIAIILILLSTLSIMISGFVNDSKREAADEKARIISTSVQKLLTQYEISGIELKDITYTDTKGTPSTADDEPNKLIFGTGSPTGSGTISKDYFLGDTLEKEIDIGTGSKKGAYAELTKYFPKDFDGGAFYVKFSDFTCTVEYVLYTSDKESDGTYDDKYLKTNNTQLQNREAQKTLLKSKHLVGCYPYTDDVS
jgi:prepilin-type N-terminal cleavage/methylation domain-containing protein